MKILIVTRYNLILLIVTFLRIFYIYSFYLFIFYFFLLKSRSIPFV
jgi:hypothetical protein